MFSILFKNLRLHPSHGSEKMKLFHTPVWPRNVHRNSSFSTFFVASPLLKTLMEILSPIIFYDPYVLNIAAASHSETTSVRKVGWCCFHLLSFIPPQPRSCKIDCRNEDSSPGFYPVGAPKSWRSPIDDVLGVEHSDWLFFLKIKQVGLSWSIRNRIRHVRWALTSYELGV